MESYITTIAIYVEILSSTNPVMDYLQYLTTNGVTVHEAPLVFYGTLNTNTPSNWHYSTKISLLSCGALNIGNAMGVRLG